MQFLFLLETEQLVLSPLTYTEVCWDMMFCIWGVCCNFVCSTLPVNCRHSPGFQLSCTPAFRHALNSPDILWTVSRCLKPTQDSRDEGVCSGYLMVWCSIDHKSCLLQVSGWDQTGLKSIGQKSKYTSYKLFSRTVPVIWGSCYPALC